jgi:hypothetical protein
MRDQNSEAEAQTDRLRGSERRVRALEQSATAVSTLDSGNYELFFIINKSWDIKKCLPKIRKTDWKLEKSAKTCDLQVTCKHFKNLQKRTSPAKW